MALTLYDLTVGRIVSPIGLDDPHPHFAWKMRSDRENVRQRSYRIWVADREGTGVWDSGEVETSRAVGIRYEGTELSPESRYTVRLTVTAEDGEKASAETFFETGLLDFMKGRERWKGAAFLGPEELSLSADVCGVFGLTAEFQIPEGSHGFALIFG